MQKDTDYASIFSFISIVLVVLLGIGMISMNTNINENQEAIEGIVIPDTITADELSVLIEGINIPTADDIVALIDIPEMPDTLLSLREDLKDTALIMSDEEFDFDEVEDLFGNDDEVTLIREYDNDREFYGITLGIDNEDDRTINIVRVYKVHVDEDNGADYNNKVYVTYKITSDDGELEIDAKYSLTN